MIVLPFPTTTWGAITVNMEQYDLALENYNKAIALGTADYQTYNNRGKVWVEFKEYEKALADYNIALEKKPRYAEGLSNRGSAYGFLGKYPEAIRDFTASLEIDPGSRAGTEKPRPDLLPDGSVTGSGSGYNTIFRDGTHGGHV